MALIDTRRILLGEITGVHGIRGEIVVRSYAAEPQDIAAYGPLDDETGQRKLVLSVRRVTPKGVVAAVEGVVDRTAAERLRGTKLYIARLKLPAAAKNEFYHADLMGLAAFDPAGAHLGDVAGVHNFGAGDILEIRLTGSAVTEMVPFTDAAVPVVDLGNGRVVVVLPTGAEEED